MKITFSTYHPIQFRGLDDALNKIKSQLNTGGISSRNGFTPAPDGGTVIIENYYEGGKDRADFSKLGNGRGSAAAEGAVSGATTGTAIEGTKTVAKKIKNSTDNVEKPHENAIDADDSSSIDLLGEDKNTEILDKKINPDELESVSDGTDKNIGIEETDVVIEPGVDVDIDPEIEIEPEIEVDPEIDVDIDVFDAL